MSYWYLYLSLCSAIYGGTCTPAAVPDATYRNAADCAAAREAMKPHLASGDWTRCILVVRSLK